MHSVAPCAHICLHFLWRGVRVEGSVQAEVLVKQGQQSGQQAQLDSANANLQRFEVHLTKYFAGIDFTIA